MKTSYLNTWLQDFPKLAYLLSSEDKAVLDKIDPRKYQHHNLTRETEVIRIINDHTGPKQRDTQKPGPSP